MIHERNFVACARRGDAAEIAGVVSSDVADRLRRIARAAPADVNSTVEFHARMNASRVQAGPAR